MKGQIADLKKEIQSLSGKLGAQGYAINREEKVKSLKVDLESAYNQIEALERDKRQLRDDMAMAALNGILSCFKEYSGISGMEDRVKHSYRIADLMIKEREKGNAK